MENAKQASKQTAADVLLENIINLSKKLHATMEMVDNKLLPLRIAQQTLKESTPINQRPNPPFFATIQEELDKMERYIDCIVIAVDEVAI